MVANCGFFKERHDYVVSNNEKRQTFRRMYHKIFNSVCIINKEGSGYFSTELHKLPGNIYKRSNLFQSYR